MSSSLFEQLFIDIIFLLPLVSLLQMCKFPSFPSHGMIVVHDPLFILLCSKIDKRVCVAGCDPELLESPTEPKWSSEGTYFCQSINELYHHPISKHGQIYNMNI